MVIGIFVGGIFLGFSLGFANHGSRIREERSPPMPRGASDEKSAYYQRTFSHPQVLPGAAGQAAGLRRLMFVYPQALKG